jgi:hypothetical protein
VANVKNVNRLSNDGEKNPVGTNSLAVNQLANLDIELPCSPRNVKCKREQREKPTEDSNHAA